MSRQILIFISVSLLALFTELLFFKYISDICYTYLVGGLMALNILYPVAINLISIDIKGMRLTLKEIKRENVNLTDLVVNILRLFGYSLAFQGRLTGENTITRNRKIFKLLASQIIDEQKLTKDNKEDIMQFFGMMEEFDKLKSSEDKIQFNKKVDKVIEEMMKDSTGWLKDE